MVVSFVCWAVKPGELTWDGRNRRAIVQEKKAKLFSAQPDPEPERSAGKRY
jgi:hypothetical protein